MTDRESRSPPSPRRNRLLRGVLVGGAVLVGLLLLVLVVAWTVVDGDFVEERARAAVASATDGSHELEAESVEVGWLPPSVRAEGVEFAPRQEAPDRQRTGGGPVVTIRATDVEVRGIAVPSVALGGALRAEAIDMREPRIIVRMPDAPAGDGSAAGERESGGERGGASEREGEPTVHLGIAGRLPPITVDAWRITDGSLSLRDAEGEESFALDGVSARLDNVAVDSAAARDSTRVLFSEAVRIRVPGYRRFLSDSLYLLEFGPVRASSADSSVRVRGARIGPTVSDEEFVRRNRFRRDRVIASVRELSLDAVDLRGLLEEGRIAAAAVELDSFLVDVYSDKRRPADPDSRTRLPHESFGGLDRPVGLDTIRIRRGHVRYAERPPDDGGNPGVITFEETTATIGNVTNDSARMSPETPAVIRATTLVAGAGRLATEIRYDLLSPDLALEYRGGVGEMSATVLNPMFLNLEGIDVRSGRVDTLWFDADLSGGHARGRFGGRYRNLQIEMLDRVDREQDLIDAIRSFIAGEVMMESRNPPDEDEARVGTIDHRIAPGDPIFKYMWESLRSGIFSLIGL